MITRHISQEPDVIAPDGSQVRILAATLRGSMAQFTLPAGQISIAVAHCTVEEVWYFMSGYGQIWRKSENAEDITKIRGGLSISIPVGTHFQFRNDGVEPLVAIGTTMPPWSGMDEAYSVEGIWSR